MLLLSFRLLLLCFVWAYGIQIFLRTLETTTIGLTRDPLQDYFSSTVGAVKKVLLNYNKTGRSTGVATIIFSQPGSASKAATDFDGVKVDGRPMRVRTLQIPDLRNPLTYAQQIEVILGAKFVPAPPAPKTLGERIA